MTLPLMSSTDCLGSFLKSPSGKMVEALSDCLIEVEFVELEEGAGANSTAGVGAESLPF